MPDFGLLSRRQLATAVTAAAFGVGGAFSGGTFSRPASAAVDPDTAWSMENRVRAFMKANSILEKGRVIWHVRGIIYAYNPPQQPVPIMRVKNCEQQWVTPLAPARFRKHNSLITFYCDYETNKILEEFKNPFTGKVNRPRPHVSRLKEGQEISEEGVHLNVIRKAFPDFYKDAEFDVEIDVVEDTLAFRGEMKWPPSLNRPPSGSVMSNFSRYSEVMDPKWTWVDAHFGGHVRMSYFPWMEMGDADGHLLWHVAGYKLKSLDSLPPDYLDKVRAEYGDIFEKSPEFDEGPSVWDRRLQRMGLLPES